MPATKGSAAINLRFSVAFKVNCVACAPGAAYVPQFYTERRECLRSSAGSREELIRMCQTLSLSVHTRKSTALRCRTAFNFNSLNYKLSFWQTWPANFGIAHWQAFSGCLSPRNNLPYDFCLHPLYVWKTQSGVSASGLGKRMLRDSPFVHNLAGICSRVWDMDTRLITWK